MNMGKERLFPDYVFESSWEVCNKVGGIYTVLSTRARTLTERLGDHLIFIGPDCWHGTESLWFCPDSKLLAPWVTYAAEKEGLHVRVGRWNIPGKPIAILVDYNPYFEQKNEIYTRLWEWFKVDSLHGYGDYNESSMFSYAAALVVRSYCQFYLKGNERVVYHGNEWMTGLGLLWLRHEMPQVATLFTTHATSIGRSIAGNNKPLYQYLPAYNGDQMAQELCVESKHSIEKQTAWNVDCFTTVSDITATECAQLLDKPVDKVLPNGFEDDFVPSVNVFRRKRKEARQRMFNIANALTGIHFDDDTLVIATSGRNEFRNKGIDVFIDSMNRLRQDERLKHRVLAFIEVPAWVDRPRGELRARLQELHEYETPMRDPQLTHWLKNMNEDRTLGMLRWLGFENRPEDKVTLIIIPTYLTGNDGIVNQPYYDFITGNDLSVYASYYEPWGYTPLESIAFKVPCVTTDLAGFGLWAETEGAGKNIETGVKVVHRTDYNYDEVCNDIRDTVVAYTELTPRKRSLARTAAEKLSKKALWEEFIEHYYDAYDIALRNAKKRKH